MTLTAFPAFDWSVLAAITVVAAFVGAVIWWVLQSKIATEFVSKKAHDELAKAFGDLSGQVRKIETQIAALPTQGEFETLAHGVANVQSGLAGVQASLVGIAGNVRALLDNALQKDRP